MARVCPFHVSRCGDHRYQRPQAAVQSAGRLLSKIVNPGLDAFEAVYLRFSKMYQPAVEAALNNKAIVILSAVGLLAVSAYIGKNLGAELIPALTQGEFQFEVRLPEGKALQQTDGVMRSIEDQVMKYPEVRSVFSSVGGSNKNQFARESKEENVAQLYVVMKEKKDKLAESRDHRTYTGGSAAVSRSGFTFSRPTLFSVKTPVEVEIYAYDLDLQRKAANTLVTRLQGIRGLNDIRTSTELGNPEIQVRFDREKLARLGLDEEHGIERDSQQGPRRCGDALSRGRQADRNTRPRRRKPAKHNRQRAKPSDQSADQQTLGRCESAPAAARESAGSAASRRHAGRARECARNVLRSEQRAHGRSYPPGIDSQCVGGPRTKRGASYPFPTGGCRVGEPFGPRSHDRIG